MEAWSHSEEMKRIKGPGKMLLKTPSEDMNIKDIYTTSYPGHRTQDRNKSPSSITEEGAPLIV